MKCSSRAAQAIVIVVLASPVLLAQWPRNTPRGISTTADGKPDPDAPTPRAADGKPDLSGVWEIGRAPGAPAPSRGGRGASDAAAATPVRGATPESAPTSARGASGAAAPAEQGRGRGGFGCGAGNFGNIGGGEPDCTAPYQPWAAEIVKKRMADNSKDNPDAHCLPMGIAQLNGHPFPRKIIQTPSEVLIIYEGSGTTVREVFLDGRALPGGDADPWWNGYSIGHWEGDTLVIETKGFMDDGWLDVRGSPLTSAGKITERFRRPKFGSLELEETIDDPKAYTRPFTARLYYRLNANIELIEFVCLDKDASHYVGGSGLAPAR